MRRTLACALAALLLCMAPQAGAKGLAAQGDLAMGYLADHVATAATLNANIAEAAHANGLDPASWPSDDPVAQHILIPGDEAASIALLRPLRALALAHDARADRTGSLTQRVLDRFEDDGYGDAATLNDDAYAILALGAAGFAHDDAHVQLARSHLLANVNADGGWGWARAAPSGTDLTGLTVEALVASGGVPDDVRSSTLRFLAMTQAQRGFAESPGGLANCESTVWGLRATARLGADLRDTDWWFLLELQQRDGGFAHLPGGASDLLCSTEVTALLGEARAGSIAGPDLQRDDRRISDLGAAVLVAAIAMCAAARSFGIRRP